MKPHSDAATALNRRPVRRSSWLWPIAIATVLVVHVLGMVTATVIATRDRSFVVLPDYYKRAQQWDERKAAIAASDKLGWHRSLNFASASASHSQLVTLCMTDSAKNPINGLSITIVASPERQPDHTQKLTFIPSGDGTYTATINVPYGGAWMFEIDARRGAEHYVATASPWLAETN